MSEAKPLNFGSEAPDAEVELSAQDLLDLSGPCENNKRAEELPARTKIVSVETSTPAPQMRAAPPPVRRPMPFVRVAASLTVAVGLVVASHFVVKAGQDAARSVAQQAPQSELPAAAPEGVGKSAAGAPAAGVPVLFANPFDAKEVFEFPAGTTQAEARDEVAEILMARAMERQRQFDARISSNR